MRLKEALKQFVILHRGYKFLKNLPQIRLRRILEFSRMVMIWKVLPNTMLPIERLFSTCDCVDAINREKLSGDIVECGVWSGGCVGLMAITDLEIGSQSRRYIMFDSFEGLPQPSAEDKEVVGSYKENHPGMDLWGEGGDSDSLTAIGACVGADQPRVESFLVSTLGIPRQRLKFYVGWFQDTTPVAKRELGPIAILRLDGDWYESTKVCLDNLYDLVIPNGFVIIDDYGTFTGCRKAVDEFRAIRGIKSEMVFVDDECCYFRVPI